MCGVCATSAGKSCTCTPRTRGSTQTASIALESWGSAGTHRNCRGSGTWTGERCSRRSAMWVTGARFASRLKTAPSRVRSRTANGRCGRPSAFWSNLWRRSMESLGIALIGCGTVGSGVARLLLEHHERLAVRAGRPLVLRHVVVRDPAKPRPAALTHLVTTDLASVLNDPSIQVAVELVGGVEWARQAVFDLLEAGKDVVTANKALLALHGADVFECARRHGRAVAFEASVAGGVPIIAALSQS